MQILSDSAIFVHVIVALEQTFSLSAMVVYPTTTLKDDLSIGWFGRLQLIILIEEMFDLEITNDKVAQFMTLGDIVRFLRDRIGPLAPVLTTQDRLVPESLGP